MKVVIDTNVIVSAFAFDGKPRLVLDLAISRVISAHISEILFAELVKTLKQKFHFSDIQLNDVENIVREKFTFVTPKRIPNSVTRDPDDSHVLAITSETKIDFIISGDKDLLTLEHYRKIPILTPNEFLLMHDLANEP